MGLSCGIIGLPNVGKSTLFNALTSTTIAAASNYPFCTIDPNIGKVNVPDQRLYNLAKIAKSLKIIFTQLEFIDIAGLVRGASKGAGLGNRFLSNIRQVDAIIHVIRCFKDDNITHIEGNIDPLRDVDVVETELMIADLDTLERRRKYLCKKVLESDDKKIINIIDQISPLLDNGYPARNILSLINAEEQKIFHQLKLLSGKPVLYVCNVDEDSLIHGSTQAERVIMKAIDNNIMSVLLSVKIEDEIAQLADEERYEFLKSLDLHETGLSVIIKTGYKLLDLYTFFTVGPQETRAWTIKRGTKALDAASIIHTDFAKGFIRAEIITYDDFISYRGLQGTKDAGKMRLEGREYLIQDGDIVHFRFNL